MLANMARTNTSLQQCVSYILGLRPILESLPVGPGGLANILTCEHIQVLRSTCSTGDRSQQGPEASNLPRKQQYVICYLSSVCNDIVRRPWVTEPHIPSSSPFSKANRTNPGVSFRRDSRFIQVSSNCWHPSFLTYGETAL